jgi:hypothetical protein
MLFHDWLEIQDFVFRIKARISKCMDKFNHRQIMYIFPFPFPTLAARIYLTVCDLKHRPMMGTLPTMMSE